MFELIPKLLLQKQLKFEKGHVEIFNEAGGFLPFSTYVEIQKRLEKKGLENTLYFSAKETGLRWNKKMLSAYGAKTPREIFEWGENVMNFAGWGELRMQNYDAENGEFMFRVFGSPMAKEYGKSDHPVDNILRGLFAGSCSLVAGKDIDAIETKCASMGADYCEFEMKEKKKLNMSNPLIKKQIQEIK